MATIKVKAKVNGTHAVTGMELKEGAVYSIDEEFFGPEVFERIDIDAEAATGSGTAEKEG